MIIITNTAAGIPLADDTIQCVVTSPPYWNQRNYNVEGQLGAEHTPEQYITNLVQTFHEIRRCLKPDGTVWLNLGDSHHNKNLLGIPWRAALALQADGWYLRADIIWHKPNAMPESIKDRPASAHEYLFLLTKSPQYYYDHKAIQEPCISTDIKKFTDNGKDKQRGHSRRHAGFNSSYAQRIQEQGAPTHRNKRSVWTVAVKPSTDNTHFAAFPPELIKPCILAGSRVGDIVLDPFSGTGTTKIVADGLSRKGLGLELNPNYARNSLHRMGLVA